MTHRILGTFADTATLCRDARPKPSPSFNAETKEHVQPLVGRKSDVDESYVPVAALQPPQIITSLTDWYYRFIGKTGGEIFHEMMLRHNVKHICTSSPLLSLIAALELTQLQLAIPVVPSCPFSMRSTTPPTLTSSFPGTSRELDTWPRAMRELPESLVSSW